MIQYITDNIPMPSIKKNDVSQWIKRTVAKYQCKTGDIAFIFCDDEKILEINRQYLQHDYYTDIITFDYTANNIVSGDIFISIDTVKSNSEAYHTDFHQELHRIIIHGVLHLCGQDDKTAENRAIMTEKENDALKDFLTL